MLRAFGNGAVFGEAYGPDAPTVVFLHGWRRSHEDFAATANALGDLGVSSVALDLPGFGATALPTVAGGARMYAELLRDTFADISVAPLVLVGHSFGARIATVAAATSPERVRGLVLTGAPLVHVAPSRGPRRSYQWLRQLHARGLLSDSRMEAARQRYGSPDYRAATGLLRDILVVTVNESYENELAQLTSPTHLLWGREDREVPLVVAERARDIVARDTPVTLTVIDGVGHLLPTQDPAALRDAVLTALEPT